MPGGDDLAVFRVRADVARQRQKLDREFKLDVGGRHVLRNAGTLGLLVLGIVLRLAELNVRTKASGFHRDVETGCWVFAEHAIALAAGGRERARVAAFGIVRAADECTELAGLEVELAGAAAWALTWIAAVGTRFVDVFAEHRIEHVQHFGHAHVLDAVDGADEVGPEIPQDLLPGDFIIRDFVELLFEIGGEVELDVTREEVLQERDDDAALVFGGQALFLELHIAAVLQHLQDRCIGRRPADAEFFHALDQRGFREARWRLGEVLRDVEALALQRFAFAHGGEAAALFIIRIVVAAFLIDCKEAVELDDLTGGAQLEGARTRLRRDIDSGAFEFSRFHLACDGAHPDQFVQACLIVIEAAAQAGWAARQISRADRFVRFLRVLRLRRILTRRIRHVVLAVFLADHLAGLRHGFGRNRDTVGSHIGNETGGLAADVDAFIQTLRDAHGVRGRKAELAAGFLLQR